MMCCRALAGYNSRSTGEKVEVVVEMVNTAKQEAQASCYRGTFAA